MCFTKQKKKKEREEKKSSSKVVNLSRKAFFFFFSFSDESSDSPVPRHSQGLRGVVREGLGHHIGDSVCVLVVIVI